MKYDVISADCHVDLIWLPPDLFTANASAAFKERMPYVADGPRGRAWVTKNGASFGLDCGMGSAGRLYEPGKMPRSTRMASTGLPVHFHTIGGAPRDFSKLSGKTLLAARAASITQFQMHMADVLMSIIFAGVLEHRPSLKIVIGEAGTGWIPYILDRMDAEWEDQFKELDLKMKPSGYWYRQCYATYQSDPIGVKLIEELGVDNKIGRAHV